MTAPLLPPPATSPAPSTHRHQAKPNRNKVREEKKVRGGSICPSTKWSTAWARVLRVLFDKGMIERRIHTHTHTHSNGLGTRSTTRKRVYFLIRDVFLDSQQSQCAPRRIYILYCILYLPSGQIKAISIIINCLQSNFMNTENLFEYFQISMNNFRFKIIYKFNLTHFNYFFDSDKSSNFQNIIPLIYLIKICFHNCYLHL